MRVNCQLERQKNTQRGREVMVEKSTGNIVSNSLL